MCDWYLGTHSILSPVEKTEEKISMASVLKFKHIPFYLIYCLFILWYYQRSSSLLTSHVETKWFTN